MAMANRVLRQGLELGEFIGKGGEASVFALKSDPKILVKRYHHPTADHAQKLAIMIANPPRYRDDTGRTLLAWPTGVALVPGNKKVLGFLMPRVTEGTQAAHLHNMKSRLLIKTSFHWRYLVRAGGILSFAVLHVQPAVSVIGVVNDLGVLVGDDTDLALVS